jgi:hypothetical protein
MKRHLTSNVSAGMIAPPGSGLNPNSEDRGPKENRSPKADFTDAPGNRPLQPGELVRISVFGPLSVFGPRPSDLRLARPARHHGYLLTEALVYIGVLFLLLGVGYGALYRLIDNSVALRRNADDILRSMHAGELWRSDVRAATRSIHLDNNANEQILRLESVKGQVVYRFSGSALFRRIGSGPWSLILDRVKSSSMQRDQRPTVTAWRWELEIQPQTRGSFKPGRVRPLFTFLAVPPSAATP